MGGEKKKKKNGKAEKGQKWKRKVDVKPRSEILKDARRSPSGKEKRGAQGAMERACLIREGSKNLRVNKLYSGGRNGRGSTKGDKGRKRVGSPDKKKKRKRDPSKMMEKKSC